MESVTAVRCVKSAIWREGLPGGIGERSADNRPLRALFLNHLVYDHYLNVRGTISHSACIRRFCIFHIIHHHAPTH